MRVFHCSKLLCDTINIGPIYRRNDQPCGVYNQNQTEHKSKKATPHQSSGTERAVTVMVSVDKIERPRPTWEV